jgi:hypothetical protein
MPRIRRRISPSTSCKDSLTIAPWRIRKIPSTPSIASESATVRNSAQKRSTTASATVAPGIALMSTTGTISQPFSRPTSDTPATGEASLSRISSPRLTSKSSSPSFRRRRCRLMGEPGQEDSSHCAGSPRPIPRGSPFEPTSSESTVAGVSYGHPSSPASMRPPPAKAYARHCRQGQDTRGSPLCNI